MDIIKTYFIDPIYYNTGYNVVNTVVFAVILIAAVLLVYKMLKHMKIKVDRNFFYGIVPFIALGGILRAYEDLLEATGANFSLLREFVITDAFGVRRNLLLISPFIYVVIFIIAFAALLASRLIWKEAYWKAWLAAGAILDILILSQLRFSSAFAVMAVTGITVAWAAAFLGLKFFSDKKNVKKLKTLLTGENMFLIDVHMFEATTTFVALQFPQQLGTSYFEQHVVAGFLTTTFGAASFFLLKLAIVPIVLYYFDKELKDDPEKRTFLKLIVLVLGMGPGLRNFLRLVMGV